MRVLLINAGNDDRHPDVTNRQIFPPLNILSIASAVEQEFEDEKDVEVQICDGEIHDIHYVNRLIKNSDVVGISVLSSSHRNAMTLAEEAKRCARAQNRNIVTVLGNDHAATLDQQILRGKRGGFIDYICTADVGEIAFCRLLRYLRGDIRNIEEVPKITYARAGKIQRNDGSELPNADSRYPLNSIPPVNWNLVRADFQTYRINFQKAYGRLLKKIGVSPSQTRPVTINRMRGCNRWPDRCCLYCGILNLSYRRSSPEVFWNEVRTAREILHANIFYEAFDSMSSSRQWVKELVQEKPTDMNDVRFFVYSQALQVESDLVELYKDLGVFMVNMGLDSGDETMLRRLKSEDDAVAKNGRAVELLSEAGILVYASFVLGAPGETEASLRETRRFAVDLMKKRQLAAIEVQSLYPLFNSNAGRLLRNPDLAEEAEDGRFKIRAPEKLRKIAKIDPMELWGVDTTSRTLRRRNLSKDWVDIFCEVKYKRLLETIDEIGKDAKFYGIPCGHAW